MQPRYLAVGVLTLLSAPLLCHQQAATAAPYEALQGAPVQPSADPSSGGPAEGGNPQRDDQQRRAPDATGRDREIGLVLAKTATYEVGTSLLETGMLAAFFGGTAGGAGGAFAAVLATTSAVYLVHEFAWRAAKAEDTPPDDAKLVAEKSVTYRIADLLRAFAIGTVLGGAQMAASAVYVATLTIAELGLYATNEVAFARLHDKIQTPAPEPTIVAASMF